MELKTQFQQGQKGGHASKKEIDRKRNIPQKEMYFRRFHTSSIYYLMNVFFDMLKKEKKNRKKIRWNIKWKLPWKLPIFV